MKHESVQNHVILGDVNLDLLKLDKNAEEYFYLMAQQGYLSMINTESRVDRSKSCIDNIFLKSKFKAKAGKLIHNMTDHYPILIEFSTELKCTNS